MRMLQVKLASAPLVWTLAVDESYPVLALSLREKAERERDGGGGG